MSNEPAAFGEERGAYVAKSKYKLPIWPKGRLQLIFRTLVELAFLWKIKLKDVAVSDQFATVRVPIVLELFGNCPVPKLIVKCEFVPF